MTQTGQKLNSAKQPMTNQRNYFDTGEIYFVANNMDCITRNYVIKTHAAAMRRARNNKLPKEFRDSMRAAAEKMKNALRTWPKGRFDSSIPGDTA